MRRDGEGTIMRAVGKEMRGGEIQGNEKRETVEENVRKGKIRRK